MRKFLILLVVFTNNLIHGQNTTLPTNSSELSVSFRKCKCDINAAIVDDVCSRSKNMLIPFWDSSSQTIREINTLSVNITLQPILNCPPGTRKKIITYFVIYENGELDDLEWTDDPLYSDYCIEYHSEGERTVPYAEVCTEIPQIPICCPFKDMEECPEKPLFPPVMYQKVDWKRFNILYTNITCPEGYITTNEPLGTPLVFGASLIGYPPGKMLMWFTEYMDQPTSRQDSEYCLEPKKDETYAARFCVPDPELQHEKQCPNGACLRKCCPRGLMYDTAYTSCVPSNETLELQFYSTIGKEQNISKGFKIIYGLPLCEDIGPSHLKLVEGSNSTVYVQDGKVTIDGQVQNDPKKFCVDYLVDDFTDSESQHKISAVTCFISIRDECQWRYVLTSILLGISCVFYLMTLLVYVTIPDLHRNILGKCLVSQVSALLVTYTTLIYLQNNRYYTTIACNLPGTIEHVAALASFFWLNVICYDIWKTLKTVRVAEAHKSSSRKFLLYSLYGWGGPLLISLARVVIDNLPEDIDGNFLIRANLGQTHCFFTSKYAKAKWVYLYLPVLIIIIMNSCLFLHVVIILHRTQKENLRSLQGSGSSRTGKSLNAKKDKVRLYMKLFLVMGLTWMLEIVMWISVSENDCYFWLLDIINMFQGVFIFIIFVCKKSTIQKIKDHLGLRKPKPDVINLDLNR